MPAHLNEAYSLDTRAVAEKLHTSAEQGLTEQEARSRIGVYGRNVLKQKKPVSVLLLLISQFASPIVWILAAAGALAFVFQEWVEGIAILAVILLNAAIGFVMEWQAVRSMEALRQLARTRAVVIRSGKKQQLDAEALVPGDVVYLEAGDVVPADARLVALTNFAAKEAALTGESAPVEKQTARLPEDTLLADRQNMVFKGTVVTTGHATAIVAATGSQTELGRIAELAEAAEKEATPLEKKLETLGRKLIWLTLALAAAVLALGLWQGRPLFLMVETAVALAVAAIPEGLPIVATIALARGMLQLSRKNVLVKSLEAVQTLGEATLICTDKTGTLTENEMHAGALLLPSGRVQTDALPDFRSGESAAAAPAARLLLQTGLLCNNATFHPDDTAQQTGDPIEIALLRLGHQLGLDARALAAQYPRKSELPFSSDTKFMATLHHKEDRALVCVKGALEAVLERCAFVQQQEAPEPLHDRQHWHDQTEQLAAEGYRVLAFAYREAPEAAAPDFAHDLVLLGLAAFMDPPRPDVRGAIETCRQAGIRVVMVTGDHPATARHIAVQVGLADPGQALVVHGRELQQMEKLQGAELEKALQTNIFARVTPAQKLSLVTLYQQHGQTVGMTGDGVNDAPALKKADIGIAMGIRGTEAAKEVADLILQDDAFPSIVVAIRQGRVIFENIRKFVVYLLSCNLSEILVVSAAFFAHLPQPLLPLQILFLNLVTDVFPALALGMGRGEADVMREPPHQQQQGLLTRQWWVSLVVYGLAIVAAVMGVLLYSHFVLGYPEQDINNITFYTLTLAQLWNVFNVSRANTRFFSNDVIRNVHVWLAIGLCLLLVVVARANGLLSEVLHLQMPLTAGALLLVLGFSLLPVVLVQLLKRLGVIA